MKKNILKMRLKRKLELLMKSKIELKLEGSKNLEIGRLNKRER